MVVPHSLYEKLEKLFDAVGEWAAIADSNAPQSKQAEEILERLDMELDKFDLPKVRKGIVKL